MLVGDFEDNEEPDEDDEDSDEDSDEEDGESSPVKAILHLMLSAAEEAKAREMFQVLS